MDRVASRRPEAAWPPQGQAGIHIYHRRCKMKEKKQWQKPALIVLVRRKPEEAVLFGCKVLTQDGPIAACVYGSCDEGVAS